MTSRIIIVAALLLSTLPVPAFAAGGGGSAGGSGAQNPINTGRTLKDADLGPPGAPNHPVAHVPPGQDGPESGKSAGSPAERPR